MNVDAINCDSVYWDDAEKSLQYPVQVLQVDEKEMIMMSEAKKEAEKRYSAVKRMILADKMNEEIQNALIEKFDVGISNQKLVMLRKEVKNHARVMKIDRATPEEMNEKRRIAKRLIRQGKSNNEVNDALLEKFKAGLSAGPLADIRAELGMSGANRRNGKNSSGPNPPGFSVEDLVLLQGPKVSAKFKKILEQLQEIMEEEGIYSVRVDNEGKVSAIMRQEVEFDV